MALVKTVLLIDGENLVFRYQSMLQNGRIPKKGNVHIQDVFIWNPEVAKIFTVDLFRAVYYTSLVGDHLLIDSTKDQISRNIVNTDISGAGNFYGKCQLVPFVFKKEKRTDKSRLVDIFLAVDGMKYANNNNIECIAFLSGDSDFIKPYDEIMSLGKKVYVGAFSDGLGKNISNKVDMFYDLDEIFFEKKN